MMLEFAAPVAEVDEQLCIDTRIGDDALWVVYDASGSILTSEYDDAEPD